MKVAADIVVQFLKDLRYQALGIIDTIRCGDDGFEQSCKWQIADMLKAMDVFRVQKLTPLTPLGAEKDKPYKTSLPTWDDVHGFSVAENIAIYKHHLYIYLKKRLPELDLLAVPTSKLAPHIEGTLLCGSPYEKDAYSNEWFYTSQAVLRDVADEIKAERERAPQLTLLKMPP